MKTAKRFLISTLLTAPCIAFANHANAGSLDRLQTLSPSEFHDLTEDLGAMLSYKAMTPTEPLGITGFDVGVGITGTSLQHKSVFEKAGGDAYGNAGLQPSLHINKGLPYDIDIGVEASTVLNTNIRTLGGEVRYAFVPGNIALPAIGVRAAYTRMFGVDQLDFNTKSLDVSISKGFANVTPYAGVGRVWTSGHPDSSTGLAETSPSLNKIYLGVNVNFLLLNLDFEGDRTGAATSYGVKFGFRF